MLNPTPALNMAHHAPEGVLASLIYMLHLAAAQRGELTESRLAQQIVSRLKLLVNHQETPEILRQVCDDLSDEWQPLLARSLCTQAARLTLVNPAYVQGA